MTFEQQLEQWYRVKRKTMLRRYARSWDQNRIEDALQDVLAKLLQKVLYENEPEPDSLDAYISVALKRRLIDLKRTSPEQKGTHIDDLDQIDEGGQSFALVSLLEAATDASDHLSGKQLLEKLMARLKPQFREVLILLLQGCSPKEIGDEMGKNGHRLVQRLRDWVLRILRDLGVPLRYYGLDVPGDDDDD